MSSVQNDRNVGQQLLVELRSGEVFEGLCRLDAPSYMVLSHFHEHTSDCRSKFNVNLYKDEIISVRQVNKDPGSDEAVPKNAEEQPARSFLLSAEYEHCKKLVNAWTYIGVCDTSFFNTVKRFSLCESLAIHAVGKEFGRLSRLSLLIVASRAEVVIFDVKLMDQKCFDSGLRALLESEAPLKVVHDAKLLADCLHHMHDVQLANVFDTQIADLFVQKKEKVPEEEMQLRPLADCVAKHLLLPPTIFAASRINPRQFYERPVTDVVKRNAAIHAVYLLSLKRALDKLLLDSLNRAIEKHLNSMKEDDHPLDTFNTAKGLADEVQSLINVD